MKVLQLGDNQDDDNFVTSLLNRRQDWGDHIPLDILYLHCLSCKADIAANKNGVIIIKSLTDQFQAIIDQIISETKEAHIKNTTQCRSSDIVISPNFGPPGCLLVVGERSPSSYLHSSIQILGSFFSPELLVQSALAADESIVAVFKREDFDDVSYKDFVTDHFFR